jgi:pilus assembly protein CpaF
MRDGVRRIQNISEIAGMEGEIITMRDLFGFHFRGERRDGTIEGDFQSTRLRPDFISRTARYGLDKELLDAIGVGAGAVVA